MTIATGQPMLAADILNLTFFPIGTILTFSSAAWNVTSAEFRNIWKVCNGQKGTPNLVNKFLRGADSSGGTGGADSQSITLQTANLPSHSHGVTNLPVANLNTSGLSIASSGGHVHSGSGTTGTSGGHTHTVSGWTISTTNAAGTHPKSLTADTPYFQLDYSRKSTNNTSGIITSTTQVNGSTDAGNSSDTCATFHIDATHMHVITGSTPNGGGTHTHDVSVSIPESGSHSHAVSGSITGGTVSGTTGSAGSSTPSVVNTVPVYYTVIYIMKVA